MISNNGLIGVIVLKSFLPVTSTAKNQAIRLMVELGEKPPQLENRNTKKLIKNQIYTTPSSS